MFAAQRLQCLRQVLWNATPINSVYNDSITILECVKSSGLTSAKENVDYRLVNLFEEQRDKNVQTGRTEATLLDWLQFKSLYSQPASAEHAGVVEGGMRIIFCDRPGPKIGMSISKTSFQIMEEAFHLHPATLPAFIINGGTVSIFNETNPHAYSAGYLHVVIKACQKAELGNLLISLSHNIATGWTNAFICGDGVLYDRPNFDGYLGSQLGQFINVITNAPSLWTNPIFLPVALLQIYSERTRLRLWWTDDRLIELENHLGVTNAGKAGQKIERESWPQDIDPKAVTKSLHSLLTRIIYMSSCCKWLLNSTEAVLQMEKRLESNDNFSQYGEGWNELRETLTFISSTTKGLDQYFTAYKERATVQVNVLFSIISQQENILNRWNSQLSLDIARASKRDSISMTTFTFITAIFLPGTFVATLFSMTMFNWQPTDNSYYNNNSNNSNNNNNNNQSISSPNSDVSSWSYVSSNFWIFWVIAVPLTLLTLGAWFCWFRYASRKWEERFRIDANGGLSPSSKVSMESTSPFDLASSDWNTPKGLVEFDGVVVHRI